MFSRYKTFFKNYTNFTDRTNRADFWWPYAINTVISTILGAGAIFWFIFGLSLSESATYGDEFMEFLGGLLVVVGMGTGFLYGVFQLAIFIPTLSSAIRRLKDAALHPALVLVYYVPLGLNVLFGLFPVINVLTGFLLFAGSIAALILLCQPSKDPAAVAAPQAPVAPVAETVVQAAETVVEKVDAAAAPVVEKAAEVVAPAAQAVAETVETVAEEADKAVEKAAEAVSNQASEL